jgi:ATP-dependent DNA helicase RecG
MSPPGFEELWHKLCSADESVEIEAKRAEELGVIDNAVYRTINRLDTRSASGRIRRLRDAGLLEQKGKGAGTYYVPGGRLLAALGRTEPEPLRPESPALRPESPPLRPESPPLRPELEALRAELPPQLRAALDDLGDRAAPAELDAVLIELAGWRPLSLEELAGLSGRAPDHLRKRNVKRLLNERRLAYLHPDEPNRPDQKYVAGKERPT